MRSYYLNVLAAPCRTWVVSHASDLLESAATLSILIVGSAPRPATELAQRRLLGPVCGRLLTDFEWTRCRPLQFTCAVDPTPTLHPFAMLNETGSTLIHRRPFPRGLGLPALVG